MRILPETPATYARWRDLVEQFKVSGVRVHDTNIVAVAETYGACAIITLNAADFSRFTYMKSLSPDQIIAGAS